MVQANTERQAPKKRQNKKKKNGMKNSQIFFRRRHRKCCEKKAGLKNNTNDFCAGANRPPLPKTQKNIIIVVQCWREQNNKISEIQLCVIVAALAAAPSETWKLRNGVS